MADGMLRLLQSVDCVHTITLDNGSEFAHHARVTKASGADIYFAKPYASYQRGTNENTNGLIRRYWPKGTDFEALTETEVRDMELPLNMMPRLNLVRTNSFRSLHR